MWASFIRRTRVRVRARAAAASLRHVPIVQIQKQQINNSISLITPSSDLISSITAAERARARQNRRARTRNHLSTQRDEGAWRRMKMRKREGGQTGAQHRLTHTRTQKQTARARAHRGGYLPVEQTGRSRPGSAQESRSPWFSGF